MTQYPNPYNQPHGYLMQYASPPASGAPKVLGIIGIIYAGLGLLLRLLFTLFAAAALAGDLAPEIPTWQVVAEIGLNGLAMILAVLLLVGSIGLVRYRRSGAMLTQIWAIVSLVSLLGWIGLAVAQSQYLQPPPGADPQFAAGYRFGAIAGGVCVHIIRGILPLVMLILLNRPQVKASLE